MQPAQEVGWTHTSGVSTLQGGWLTEIKMQIIFPSQSDGMILPVQSGGFGKWRRAHQRPSRSKRKERCDLPKQSTHFIKLMTGWPDNYSFQSHLNATITHFFVCAVHFSQWKFAQLFCLHVISWRLNHRRMDLVFCSLRIFQIDLWNPLAFLWARRIIIIPVCCFCLLIYWTMRSCSVIRCRSIKDASVESSPHLSLKRRYIKSRTSAQIWAAWADIKFCDWINLSGIRLGFN